MKFVIAALLGVALGAEEWDEGRDWDDKNEWDEGKDWDESDGHDDYMRGMLGEVCHTAREKSGCEEGLRCASAQMEGMENDMFYCIGEQDCGQEQMGIFLECGAKALT